MYKEGGNVFWGVVLFIKIKSDFTEEDTENILSDEI